MKNRKGSKLWHCILKRGGKRLKSTRFMRKMTAFLSIVCNSDHSHNFNHCRLKNKRMIRQIYLSPSPIPPPQLLRCAVVQVMRYKRGEKAHCGTGTSGVQPTHCSIMIRYYRPDYFLTCFRNTDILFLEIQLRDVDWQRDGNI